MTRHRLSSRISECFVAAVVAVLAVLVFSPIARAAGPEPSRRPLIRASAAVAGPDGLSPAVQFDLDRAGVADLRKAGRGRLDLPIPGRGTLALDLERYHVLAPDAQLMATGAAGPAPYSTDLRIFKGTNADDPDAWAVLGFSADRVVGSVHTKDGTWTILTPELSPQKNGHHLVYDESTTAPEHDDACATVDEPARWPDPGILGPQAAENAVSTDRLVCRMALDADFEFYSGTFGSDLSAATNYLLTMMATVSAMYERDVNVTLEVGYLNIYTTSGDPYDQIDAGDQLNQFRNYWNANHAAIARDDAFLFSGRGYGSTAGIAYLNVLCTSSAYGLGSITQASGGFPTNQVVFNAILTAHEIGHNFGSPHTHSCYWQSAGYAPAGALLDTCEVAEGNCNNSTPHTAYGKGTIMSYCQLRGPVSQTLRSDFHPACSDLMRLVAEASCLSPATVQPPTALAIVDNAGTQTLTWSPSVSSGVLSYDVHASVYPLDYDPPLLGNTAGTTFAPLPTGTYYFKVKAVRTSDESPFSDEAKGSSCSFDEISNAADQPREITAADFNEDDIADLAVIRKIGADSAVVAIFIGQGTAGVGDGTFVAGPVYAAGPEPAATAAADFNEDGILDLAVVSYDAVHNSPGTVRLLYGQGTGDVGDGTFTAGPFYTTIKDPTEVVTGDFNEDGVVDVAVAGGFPGRAGVLLGNGMDGVGDGTLGASTQYLALANVPTGLVTGDFNNDGILDLMVASRGGGTDTDARGTLLTGDGAAGVGDGTFTQFVLWAQASIHALNVYDIRTGDFNGDGNLDVAVACDTITATGPVPRVGIALGQGNGFFNLGRGFDAGGTAVRSLDVADLDQDGTADCVVTNNETGEIPSMAALYGNGDGTLGVPLRFGTGADEGVKALARDFDEDGVPDVAASLLDRIAVFRGLCAGAPPAVIDVTSPDGGEVLGLGTEQTITWTKESAVLTVDVEVSRDDGANWETIAVDLTGTEFTWTVTPPATMAARVRVKDSTLPQRFAISDAAFTIGAPTAVPLPGGNPAAFAVSRLSANPSRDGAAFRVSVPEAGAVRMLVVDVQGRTLYAASRAVDGPGAVDVAWDGRNSAGSPVPSGMYYVRVTHGAKTAVRPVTILR